MEFNLNTALRSAVILIVGLPVSLGVASTITKTDPVTDAISAAHAQHKAGRWGQPFFVEAARHACELGWQQSRKWICGVPYPRKFDKEHRSLHPRKRGKQLEQWRQLE